mmetsp:Transcript_15022/g.44240  ORF Transcript_15022/g.44240 Transcript_15022/m.44240 type:complete len:227 (-) Transcript_15022:136-816(-)
MGTRRGRRPLPARLHTRPRTGSQTSCRRRRRGPTRSCTCRRRRRCRLHPAWPPQLGPAGILLARCPLPARPHTRRRTGSQMSCHRRTQGPTPLCTCRCPLARCPLRPQARPQHHTCRRRCRHSRSPHSWPGSGFQSPCRRHRQARTRACSCTRPRCSAQQAARETWRRQRQRGTVPRSPAASAAASRGARPASSRQSASVSAPQPSAARFRSVSRFLCVSHRSRRG